MENLSYNVLDQLNYEGFLLREGTEKIIQFGEGNFLRGFVDYFVDISNEVCGFNGKVAVVQPIESGKADILNQQQGLYTLYLRGLSNGEAKKEKRIISCISRAVDPYQNFSEFLDLACNDSIEYIISNTTEAGIVYDKTCRFEDRPPASFPAKLTRMLYERFSSIDHAKGFCVFSCELIDENGDRLKECVLKHAADWNLGDAFISWIEKENLFCNTLVDRIVTGYPQNDKEQLKNENGYVDMLLDTAEKFGLWVIEGPDWLKEKLPFIKANLPVLVTKDHRPYKKRKVRILNGIHTSMVPVAYLAGMRIVRDSMKNDEINQFVKRLTDKEIIPTIDLPKEELNQFAEDVYGRFLNPFIDHKLTDIALNSISKWTARVKPTMKDYIQRKNQLPSYILFAFAALIVFYQEVEIRDTKNVIDFFSAMKQETSDNDEVFVEKLLAKEDFFGENLNAIPGVTGKISTEIKNIKTKGMVQALSDFLRENV